MREGVLLRTVVGAAVGAGIFGVLGLYLNATIGAPLFSNPGPVAVLVVIGATIGALVGPLFRRR